MKILLILFFSILLYGIYFIILGYISKLFQSLFGWTKEQFSMYSLYASIVGAISFIIFFSWTASGASELSFLIIPWTFIGFIFVSVFSYGISLVLYLLLHGKSKTNLTSEHFEKRSSDNFKDQDLKLGNKISQLLTQENKYQMNEEANLTHKSEKSMLTKQRKLQFFTNLILIILLVLFIILPLVSILYFFFRA